MGLDMYLTKRIYIGAHHDHRNVTGTIDISIDGKSRHINLKEIDSVSLQVAYWRKANAIHGWFVDNVQGGHDNCSEYYVSKDQLVELYDLCNGLIKVHEENPKTASDTADIILPTRSGCFFGSTLYDDDYFEDLARTCLQLHNEVAAIRSGKVDYDVTYYYQASW